MKPLSAVFHWLRRVWSRLARRRRTAPLQPVTPTVARPKSHKARVFTQPRSSAAPFRPASAVAVMDPNRVRSQPASVIRSAGSGQEEQPPPAATDPLADLHPGKLPRFGKELGGSGQGTVYELPGHRGLVYKAYHTPRHGVAQSLAELVVTGERLSPELLQKGITATWPTRICSAENVVHGYVMRRIPERFMIDLKKIGLRDATLDHALAGTGGTFSPRLPVSTDERIQLLRLVAEFFSTLHRNELVYGDLSLKNMMFSRAPVELLVMDMDGVRRISAKLNRERDLVHTPDWKDPQSADQIPLGFDLDRYKFALLAYRLLVAGNVSAPLPKNGGSIASTNIEEDKHGQLAFLIRRAATSGVGARPPIIEWLDALSGCRERH